jgi:lysophospholipase L1-like esterase
MHQVLVYSDSLSWGIIPMTRNRLPFDERWPGIMERALTQSGKLVRVYRQTAAELGCYYFAAGSVTPASSVDGIHLDADQHQALGKALALYIRGLPVLA